MAVAADAYTWLGNAQISVPAIDGVLANDTLATSVPSFQNPTTQAGTVAVSADGGFTYAPPVGFIGTDSFTYTAEAADATTAQGTVTISINEKAWFVMNNFVGISDGSFVAPFTALADVVAVDAPGDIIFVFTGDGLNTNQAVGFTLQANQRLIGQGVGLSFDVLPLDPDNALLPIGGAAATAAGAAPVISDTATLLNNTPIIELASGVEVAGIIVDGTGEAANLYGMSGVGLTGFNIHDNIIRNLDLGGLQLSGATGGTGLIMNNSFQSIGIDAGTGDNAVDIITTATGVDFTLSGNTMSDVLESGIRVQFAGGNVAVTANNLTNIGTVNARRGIDIDGAGTVTISGNTLDNSGVGVDPIARSGIQVNATGALFASVTGNTVLNANLADGGIQAQTTTLGSTLCLQMTGNTTDSSYLLDNRATGGVPNFQVEGPTQGDFEAANTDVENYLANDAAFSFVPVGTCGFTP